MNYISIKIKRIQAAEQYYRCQMYLPTKGPAHDKTTGTVIFNGPCVPFKHKLTAFYYIEIKSMAW